MKDDDDDDPPPRYGKRGSQAGMLDALARERFWTSVKMPLSPWDVLKTGGKRGEVEDQD